VLKIPAFGNTQTVVRNIQRTYLDNKIISDTPIQILLLTIVSIAGIYFYELGYCRHFGIPTEFISIEMNKYSGLLFTFLATLFFISMVIDSLIGHFVFFAKIKKSYARLIIILIFIGIIIFCFADLLKYLMLGEIATLGFVCLFGVAMILNSNKSDETYDILSPKYSINIILSRKIGSLLGPILIVSSLICASLFCLGYYSGQKQTSFAARPDDKTVLLRKYGDDIIYGIINNGKVTSILVEHSNSKVDTLHSIKIK